LYPNYEKKVLRALTGMKVESYLPLYLVKRKWSDRIKLLERPLFPNYVFVRPDQKLTYEVLGIRGVVRYVSFDGRPALVPDQEIVQMRSIVAMQQHLLREQQPVAGNSTITGLVNELRCLQGGVVRRLNRTFAQIFLESFHQSVMIHGQRNSVA
jgi:transcription antitermination factor NusG